jgi:hypothetical protein
MEDEIMLYVVFAIVPKSTQGEAETKAFIALMMAPFASDGDDPQYNTYEEDGYMYNPNGHWDWYRPGGRWDGGIVGKLRDGFNFEPEFETVARNRISIATYLAGNDFAPFGIVYRNGDDASIWEDSYVTGGWAIKPEGEWVAQYRAILETMSETHDIVALDVHD